MENKSYISAYQVVLLLFISRISFSTTYQAALMAGNSIQDILLSVPINFITNFIIAVPILILLSRHPECDPAECISLTAGHGFAAVIAIFYFLFFVADAALIAGNCENYFIEAVIPDVQSYIVGIFLIIVCFYGVLKGIETIARVGSIITVFYFIVLLIITLTLIQKMDLGFIKPMLYKGITYLKGASFMNYNLSTQIVLLAFLSPYMRKSKNRCKTYVIWNILASVILFVLEFVIITVTGAYGATQNYPLQILSMLTSVSTFERTDSVNLVSWLLNAVITVALDIFLAVECFMKIGIFKKRWVAVLVSCLAVYFSSIYISHKFSSVQNVVVSGYLSVILSIFTVVIPLVVLIIDLIGGKVLQKGDAK